MKLQLFVRKLVQGILPRRGKLRRFGININGESPLCNKVEETIDHIFTNSDLALNIWSTIDIHCLIPINTNLNNMEWIEYIWIHKNWYHKIYGNPLKIIITILCAIFGTTKITEFRNHDCTPFNVIDMANKTFTNMILFNKSIKLNSLKDLADSKVLDG